MTIRVRFALLLGLVLAGFVVAAVALRMMEQSEREHRLAAERQTRAQLLNHWIDSTGRALPQFVSDLAQSEELPALLTPPAATVRGKLSAAATAAGLHVVWIVGTNGTVSFQNSPGAGSETALPLDPPAFLALVAQTPSPRFFTERNGELWEVAIRRVTGARSPHAEWIAAALRWDAAHLLTLEKLTETKVSLRPAQDVMQTPAPSDQIVLVRTLNDAQGHPLRVLRFETAATDTHNAIGSDWRQLQVFLVFGIALIAAVGLALQKWVVRPLSHISSSLSTKSAQPIAPLTADRSEMGELAHLVIASFEQRHALQNEIDQRTRAQAELQQSEEALRRNLEERARIARDLHDGVIQSLYAAGMSLVGIRALLKPDQEEAEARLEQTRAALNETIHDVRNFIIGLEPEALKRQTFSQAVNALLEVMQSMRPFKATVAIDENLAGRLTLAQRVHALQIAREAVSNAIRHGAANNIQIALRPTGDFVEFEVADDGMGFDASSSVAQGKGLANFAQRARELGAELAVQSDPGRGTRVTLTFSLIL
jgi:signal transduction histidine kinase